MTSILFLKIRVVIPSQQVNACLPIFMTDCGMVDIETLLQSQKAHSPISVKLSGKEAKSKFLSILNALLPIYVTDGGIFTCIKLKCVDFPKSLEKISHQAFANCWDLEIVNFSSAPNVDSTAFDNCKYHFGK